MDTDAAAFVNSGMMDSASAPVARAESLHAKVLEPIPVMWHASVIPSQSRQLTEP
jgi:hypothetical protein